MALDAKMEALRRAWEWGSRFDNRTMIGVVLGAAFNEGLTIENGREWLQYWDYEHTWEFFHNGELVGTLTYVVSEDSDRDDNVFGIELLLTNGERLTQR